MLENNLPSWRQDLNSSRRKEGESPSNRWVQLATVKDKNQPRLRTVVFRGWHKDTSMIIFTDRRSEKIEHFHALCIEMNMKPIPIMAIRHMV